MERQSCFAPCYEEPPRWQEFDFLAKQLLQSLIINEGSLCHVSIKNALSCLNETMGNRPTAKDVEEAKRQVKLYYVTHTREDCEMAANQDLRFFFLPPRINRKKTLQAIRKKIANIPIPSYNKDNIAKQVEQEAFCKSDGDLDYPSIYYTEEVAAQLECLWVLAEVVALKGLFKSRGLAKQDRNKLRNYAYNMAGRIEKKRQFVLSNFSKTMYLCPQCGTRQSRIDYPRKTCIRCNCTSLQRMYKSFENRLVGKS